MKTFLVLSVLLEYPCQELLENVDILEDVLREEAEENGGAAETLAPLIRYLRETELLKLEMFYTDTFDNSRKHSLYLYEHLYGEDNVRGIALANLLEKYAAQEFFPESEDPPDYIPYVLEYLALLPSEKARETFGRIQPLLGILGKNLTENGSIYDCIFHTLEKIGGNHE